MRTRDFSRCLFQTSITYPKASHPLTRMHDRCIHSPCFSPFMISLLINRSLQHEYNRTFKSRMIIWAIYLKLRPSRIERHESFAYTPRYILHNEFALMAPTFQRLYFHHSGLMLCVLCHCHSYFHLQRQQYYSTRFAALTPPSIVPLVSCLEWNQSRFHRQY